MTKYASTKAQERKSKITQHVDVIRSFIEPTSCLCRGAGRCFLRNHEECQKRRTKLTEIAEHNACSQIMSAVFELDDGLRIGVATREGTTVEEPNGDGENCSETESDGDDDNVRIDEDACVRFKFRNIGSVNEPIDTFLEAASF